MRLLVTGFGGFRGIVDNPSDRLARAMGELVDAGTIVRVESPLPVEFGRAAATAIASARAQDADAILCLGLARGAKRLRVEALARRVATSAEPDEAGRVGASSAEGPDVIASGLDVDAVVAGLVSRGFEAERSEDAGGYVCNDLYYRVLQAGAAPTLFVHVPELPGELDPLARALLESVRDALSGAGSLASG